MVSTNDGTKDEMTEITLLGPNGYEQPIPEIGMYSDATTRLKLPLFDRAVAEARTILLQPSTLASLMAGLSAVDGINSHGGKISRLLLPYLPGARQDRANPTGDIGFMLRTVANLINAYHFDEVVVVDPHSSAAEVEIDNLTAYDYRRLYSYLWKGYSGVIAPDHGAHWRAEQAHRALFGPLADRELVQAEKTRDPATGRLSGFDVTVTPGAHYLVVDDICDGGGTFVGLGEKIREQGAFADLFVTHAIFSKGTYALSQYYKSIFTTNTHYVRPPGVTVFDIITDLKENYA